MRLFGVIKHLRIATWIHRKYLARVAGGDEERAVGADGEVPNVFRFWIKKDRFVPRRRDFVDFAIRRGGNVQVIALIEDQRLRRHILGFENRGGIASIVELHHLGIRAACGIKIAM